MKTMTYPCNRCYSYSNKLYPSINMNQVTMGNLYQTKHYIYLFIPINGIPSNANILKAELTLCPVSELPSGYESLIHYRISLLNHPINPYRLCNLCTAYIGQYSLDFYKIPNSSYYTFDISFLINKWISGELVNCGFFVAIQNSDFLIHFLGSGTHGMEPSITITYEDYNPDIPPIHDDSISLPIQIDILS